MAATFDVCWAPSGGPTSFPCVDCGLLTGTSCDGGASVEYDQCFASARVPQDYSNSSGIGMQRTPLHSACETLRQFCRFCCGVKSCTPPTRRNHWSGVPLSRSRSFDATQCALRLDREFKIREAVNKARSAEAIDQQRQDEEDQRLQNVEFGCSQQQSSTSSPGADHNSR